MINGKVENIYSKASYSEDECLTKENSSCKDSFLENDRRYNDGISQLDLVDRLSVSATQFKKDDGGIMLYAQLWQMLNYNIDSNSEEIEETDSTEDQNAENNFFNLIFSSLLDLIISSKLMEMSVNNLAAGSDQVAEFKTPTNLPLLTGIAETCPPAPAPKHRPFSVKRFDLSICRKLDFEDYLN